MTKNKSLYHGHRFPAAVICCGSLVLPVPVEPARHRIVVFERGVVVSYETIRRWCDKFGAGFAHRIKASRRKPRRDMAPWTRYS
ncbi:hypothetical protein OKW50_007911 [Paraburkholderia youngii]